MVDTGSPSDRLRELCRDQAREVGRDYDGVTEVRVAIDPVAFVALQPPTGLAPPWASGVAYPAQNLVVIRVTAQEHNPRALLRHELSHVAVGRSFCFGQNV